MKELHIWKFIRFFTLYKKFDEGQARFSRILTSGAFQNKQQQIKKEAYITYHICPCCKKTFFVKENIILDNMDEKGYTGECLMCEIVLDKEDSYFSYLTSQDYNSINEFRFGYGIVSELLNDTALIPKITDQELNDIKAVYSFPGNVIYLAELTNNYLISILISLLEKYAEEIVYDFDSAKMDEGLWGNIIKESKTIDELFDDDLELLKQVIDNFIALELTSEFYQVLEEEYDFNLYRSHPNPHQDNEEEEIEIIVTLSITDDRILEN